MLWIYDVVIVHLSVFSVTVFFQCKLKFVLRDNERWSGGAQYIANTVKVRA